MKNYSIVSLKTYVDARLCDIEKATVLANENIQIRLNSLNEWRAQNKDERSQFVTRNEHAFIEEKIRQLELSRAELKGRASQRSVNITFIIGIIGLLIAIFDLILRVVVH